METFHLLFAECVDWWRLILLFTGTDRTGETATALLPSSPILANYFGCLAIVLRSQHLVHLSILVKRATCARTNHFSVFLCYAIKYFASVAYFSMWLWRERRSVIEKFLYGMAQKVSYYRIIKNRINLKLRLLDFFVKLKYQSSTMILFVCNNILQCVTYFVTSISITDLHQRYASHTVNDINAVSGISSLQQAVSFINPKLSLGWRLVFKMWFPYFIIFCCF